MLHLLHVRFDNDGAVGDHRARQFAGRGPTAETTDQQDDNGNADPVQGTDRAQRVGFVEPGRPHHPDEKRPDFAQQMRPHFAHEARPHSLRQMRQALAE
jgi:hypothetical protein